MSYAISENRSKNYIKQIKGSFIFKGLAIFASFLSIPLMIKYLGIEQYGVWSTLLSIVSWIVLFDIGIGNGLRNKISESLAQDNKQETHNYISTAYTIIGAISVILILIFLIASEYIPWQKVFNITSISNQELQNVVNIIIIFLFLNFWLGLINQVFNGFQKTSLVVFNQFLSNILSLLAVFILYTFYESSLIKLAFAYGISLVSSSLILSIWFFEKNREFIPCLKKISFSNMRIITNLGIKFFILQSAAIIIFTTDKILIIQLFGPEYVTSYDVVFKIFSIITILYAVVTAPLWASFSDAYARKDKIWLINMLNKQIRFYLFILLSTLLLGVFSKYIIKLWIDTPINIETELVISLVLFTIISTWNMLFSTFVNATNHFKVQIITSLIAMILNIPLSIIFVQVFDLGLYSIVLASSISLSIFAIFGYVETYKILKESNETEL